jgi:hypothetical protein
MNPATLLPAGVFALIFGALCFLVWRTRPLRVRLGLSFLLALTAACLVFWLGLGSVLGR